MPLVLTQNNVTVDGHDYADRLGEQYEYPTQYGRLMVTGEPFVYYRGRRGAPPGEPRYAYIGAGVVGRIDGPDDGLLTARVEDFVPFPELVPFKINGRYIEDVPDRGGSATGVFFRGASVRLLSEASYRRILRLAGLELFETDDADAASSSVAPPEPNGHPRASAAYPSPEQAAASDKAGMQVAMKAVAARWPRATIHRMAHANPGFDIAVELDGGWHYVEVKSTASSVQGFFLSEGERRFADRHADTYSLLLVTNALGAAELHWRDGALNGPDVQLEPRQWRGRLVVRNEPSRRQSKQ